MSSPDPHLSGKLLFGDDFNEHQIAEWYADEEEGYANLGAKNASTYIYPYHAWNKMHGYDHLPDQDFPAILGFGSAYGDELLPVAKKAQNITIVDPSSAFKHTHLDGTSLNYIKPTPAGRLPLPDQSFDLVTSLGVLHHIPNVSFVLSELVRVMKPGAYMLLREPIVSLGDWNTPRKGLTKRERGIPMAIFRELIDANGLEVVNMTLCAFPLTTRIFRLLKGGVYNNPFATKIDAYLSKLFAWNINYHPHNTLQRLRPMSAFYVLRKRQ